jgi:homotetrameric cytidine deaminase
MSVERDRKLVEAARAVAAHAFAPYSGYRVGAAIATSSGDIVAGANVENSSYGLSMCAERSAVFAAVSRGLVGAGAPIAAVCVHAPVGPAPWPCGACRQVLSEFADPSLVVVVDGVDGMNRTTLGDLLPHAFRLEG